MQPMRVGEFAEHIWVLCQRFHCSQTSGIRTAKRNAAVGGHPRSRHQQEFGLAADLVPDDLSFENRRAIVAEAQRRGLGALDEEDHVHIQTVRAPQELL